MGILVVETKPLHGIKRVPQCNYNTSGRQYKIGEKPSVILYTYILISMQGHQNHIFFLSKSPGLQCSNIVVYGLRGVKVKCLWY